MTQAIPASADPFVQLFPELAAVITEDIHLDGAGGVVPARRYLPPLTPDDAPGLVWVHGGGFTDGDLDCAEAHWVGLALAAEGVPVLSVDYRKCVDGVHYPAPSDDVLDAWRWACANASTLGVDPSSLHLGGASAGGNLVAGITKRLRDTAGPLPATLVLVYPLVHPALPEPTAELRAKAAAADPRTTPDNATVIACTLNFAGDPAVLSDPYAFPPNGDVSGQPPVYILNSDVDWMRASGEAYGTQLAQAGVPVRVEYEPGTAHGHLATAEHGAVRSLARIIAWLREAQSMRAVVRGEGTA